MCEDSGLASIGGSAGNRCVRPEPEPELPAQEGETCGGFNEATGGPFPDCAAGLRCVDSGLPSIGGGASNVCRKSYSVPTPSNEFSQEGEHCEGYNSATGMPFPECDEGLRCSWSLKSSIPGEENVCKKSPSYNHYGHTHHHNDDDDDSSTATVVDEGDDDNSTATVTVVDEDDDDDDDAGSTGREVFYWGEDPWVMLHRNKSTETDNDY